MELRLLLDKMEYNEGDHARILPRMTDKVLNHARIQAAKQTYSHLSSAYCKKYNISLDKIGILHLRLPKKI